MQITGASAGYYRSPFVSSIKKETKNVENSSETAGDALVSAEEEIKKLISGVNIDIADTPDSEEKWNAYAKFISGQGISKNVTLSQDVLDKMESDPDFLKKVLLNLKREFSQAVPLEANTKLITQGVVINDDGSVDGWNLSSAQDSSEKDAQGEALWILIGKYNSKIHDMLEENVEEAQQLEEASMGQKMYADIDSVIQAYRKSMAMSI